MGEHINATGQFQSEKYPTTPPDKVPLSVNDPSAWPFLWGYAEVRRAIDAGFSDDLQGRLIAVGYKPSRGRGDKRAAVDVDAAEKRASAATEGPWKADKSGVYPSIERLDRWTSDGYVPYIAASFNLQEQAIADAIFIAHARTDIPAMGAAIHELDADLAEALRERDEARAWVRKLTATDRVLTCVYCGEAYPPGSPDHGAEVLTAHVKVCAKHPMRAAEADLDAVREQFREAARIILELEISRDSMAKAIRSLDDSRRAGVLGPEFKAALDALRASLPEEAPAVDVMLDSLRLSTMTIERAKEITAQCLHNRMFTTVGLGEETPLPACSLEEMLLANRMVSQHKEPEVTAPDGTKSRLTLMTVDPRGIAAAYALQNFGGSPYALLEALGFALKTKGDDDDVSDEEEG